jgi:tight adherence protein C
LLDLTERTASPAIGQIVTGLIQAEKTGASLGPMLRVQAEQLRKQRFQYAEKKAMEAPVKLLAPLFMFIFPTTFLALGFIFVSKAIVEGFLTWSPLVWAYRWPGVS